MRKRVLFFRPELTQGGADRVTITLLQQFSRDKYDVQLCLLRKRGPLLDEVPSDVKVHDLNARSLWSAVAPLRRLLRQTRPDCLFSTCSGANVPAAIAHSLDDTSKRALVLSERSVVIRTPFTPQRLVLPFLKRALYGKAQRVTAVSDGVGQDLVSLLNVAPENVVSIGNPVVTDSLIPLSNAAIEHPFYDDDNCVIVTMGRLVDEKKHAHLIRAFAAVHRTHPQTRLVILGDGPLRAALELVVVEQSLQDVVSLPGFRKNPFPFLKHAEIFALSSSTEGLPGALIQGMALGLPAVSTDCHAGPSEIINRPGSNGELVEVGDIDGMAQTLERLVGDATLRDRLGREGQKSVARYHSDAVVAAYETTVDDALAA